MQQYLALSFSKNDEILLGLLSAYPIESFEEVADDCLMGYITEDALTDEISNEITEICDRMNVTWSAEIIESQNWNALWEASFQPIEVGQFCRVRADFHPQVAGFKYDLVINPKMAFGTGHHATTYMMMDRMANIDFYQKSVLDYGCGTGILAILASKMGADPIDAVDIENESYLNTQENADINHTGNVIAWGGDIHAVPFRQYDVILANINRNVLLASTKDIRSRLHEGGTLLISGILQEDRDIIENAFQKDGFILKDIQQREQWLCIAFDIE